MATIKHIGNTIPGYFLGRPRAAYEGYGRRAEIRELTPRANLESLRLRAVA